MRLLSAILLTAMALSATAQGVDRARVLPRSEVDVSSAPAELRKLVRSGYLADLRWPDFADYRQSLESLYEASGYSPVWFANGRLSVQARALIAVIESASEKGLNPQDYDASKLSEWADQLGSVTSAGGTARLDVGLSVAAMRYISALHSGRINPQRALFALARRDERLALSAFLRDHILLSQNVRQEIEGIEPPFPGYRRTEAVLVKYLAIEKNDVSKLPSRPRGNLKEGQAYGDLPALAARLALLGDLASPEEVQGKIYRGPIVEAMKRFQNRHGLAVSGTLDAATYRALATPLSKRVLQLQLTLERWRWLPTDVLPAVVVNIPEFELRAFGENHRVALKMPVIVGKAYRHRTPVFEDRLESIIIRPYWNVPVSIQKAEIVRDLRRDPTYLQKHRFQLVDRGNKPQATPPREELVARLASGALRVRQMPGPGNSLGLLKFNFPNEYNVYLHGTPQQNLFSQARRDFSHGCIRIEDPVFLAAWVLEGEGSWNRERIVDAMNAEQTLTIPVHRPITVLILYGSAVVEETGEVHFFDDVYGYDVVLEHQLAHGYPYSR